MTPLQAAVLAGIGIYLIGTGFLAWKYAEAYERMCQKAKY